MPSIYVPDDGYTESGFIREVPGLHPALRFKFRPMPQEQRAKLAAENAKLSDDKASLNLRKVIAAKLKEWDLVDDKGANVPVGWQVLGRFKPAVFDKIVNIVMGLYPSDDDPEATLEEAEASLIDQLAAAESGKTIGDARAERDQKN